MVDPTLGDIATTVAVVILLYNTIQIHINKKIADAIKKQTNGLTEDLIKIAHKGGYVRGLKQARKK